MKKLFTFIAIALFTTLSHATSIDRTTVIATIEGIRDGVRQVSVLEDGRLQVKLVDNTVLTSQLSKAALQEIYFAATHVSDAETKEDYRLMVCKMMPPLELARLSVSSFNYEKRSFEGTPRLIMTSQNCTTSHIVKPVDEALFQAAQELRGKIEILGLNQLK